MQKQQPPLQSEITKRDHSDVLYAANHLHQNPISSHIVALIRRKGHLNAQFVIKHLVKNIGIYQYLYTKLCEATDN